MAVIPLHQLVFTSITNPLVFNSRFFRITHKRRIITFISSYNTQYENYTSKLNGRFINNCIWQEETDRKLCNSKYCAIGVTLPFELSVVHNFSYFLSKIDKTRQTYNYQLITGLVKLSTILADSLNGRHFREYAKDGIFQCLRNYKKYSAGNANWDLNVWLAPILSYLFVVMFLVIFGSAYLVEYFLHSSQISAKRFLD